jgi:N-carbamoylputrescine amidase
MEDVCVAAILMRSVPGRTDINLEKMESFARRASTKGVDIACFPEACISGYGVRPAVRDYAEPIPGRLSDKVLRMATKNNLTILAGMIERGDEDHLYLTHFAASPRGILGTYRKSHLAPREKKIFQAGKRVPVFDEGRVVFGIELCYDGHFPELSTLLAMKGAEVLFLPHASPRGSPKQKAARWLRYMPARAVDNGAFVVVCNQVGRDHNGLSFPGVALVLDPRGRVIKKAIGWEEKILVAALSAKSLQDVRLHSVAYFLPHRRADIYEQLCQNPGQGAKGKIQNRP